MKAKRRHDLQENLLSQELVRIVNFARNQATAIAWGTLIVALIAFIAMYAYRRSVQTNLRTQSKFEQALLDSSLTPDERGQMLSEVANQTRNRPLATSALVELGNEYLRRIIQSEAGPQQQAERYRSAEAAQACFNQVISMHSDRKVLVARMRLGLAKLAENRLDFDTARREYEAVMSDMDLRGHTVVQIAESGLEQLDELTGPILLATTAPSTQPATQPTAPTEPAGP